MRMATADRLTAFVLLVLGVGMAVGGYMMERLEIRQIHPASIPGLVPMILGALMAVCALLLWQSARQHGEREAAPFMSAGSWSRLGITTGLCIVYAVVLVGWMPFFWATALFITVFALTFALPGAPAGRPRLVAAGTSLALGVGMAFAISILFEQVFLVRLP